MENIDYSPQEYIEYLQNIEKLKEDVIKKRIEISQLLRNIVDNNGNPYFTEEWIKKNILKEE